MPFGKVAGIRDDKRCDEGARKSFATGSPRPVVVRIWFEAGLLADSVPGGWPGIRCAFPRTRCSGLAVAWQRTSPFTVAGAAAASTAFPS
ncbi:DUF397 domain-containing protein [Pseudomonas sp. IT-P12]